MEDWNRTNATVNDELASSVHDYFQITMTVVMFIILVVGVTGKKHLTFLFLRTFLINLVTVSRLLLRL